jgi:UDP-glucose 4-epimerase/UDP-glucuronate decarboxylase
MKGDLTDAAFVSSLPHDFDLVFHFAAVIGVKSVSQHPDRVLYVNTVSTLLLLEHFKDRAVKPKRFVFSSTSEMVAGTQKAFGIPVPTSEEVPICLGNPREPRSTYLLSKAVGESACFTYQSMYGIPCTVVRYFNVYGPRMGFQHVVPELFIKISKQDSVEIFSPEHTRAFCYVDDAVAATLACARSEAAAGQLVNIGNASQEIRMRDLAGIIVKVLGRNVALIDGPETQGSPVRRCPDISLLKELTGFVAPTSLEDGVRKTYEWYKPRLDQRYE